MPQVTVVDYGMGNLLSVSRALEHCGAEVLLASDPNLITKAERLILPGVGAFADGMAGLRERGLIEPIRTFAGSGHPFLGICLGMQMMLETSEEFGGHEGLGLIAGKVVAIPLTNVDGRPHKIPHIGWDELVLPFQEISWAGTILADIEPGTTAYFVHSFTAVPSNLELRLADCNYNGRLISAVIRSEMLYGCQFHPEKSGETGLNILRRFIEL